MCLLCETTMLSAGTVAAWVGAGAAGKAGADGKPGADGKAGPAGPAGPAGKDGDARFGSR